MTTHTEVARGGINDTLKTDEAKSNKNVIHLLRNIGYDPVNTGGACTLDVTLPIRCIHTYQHVLVVERLDEASRDGVVSETDV